LFLLAKGPARVLELYEWIKAEHPGMTRSGVQTILKRYVGWGLVVRSDDQHYALTKGGARRVEHLKSVGFSFKNASGRISE